VRGGEVDERRAGERVAGLAGQQRVARGARWGAGHASCGCRSGSLESQQQCTMASACWCSDHTVDTENRCPSPPSPHNPPLLRSPTVSCTTSSTATSNDREPGVSAHFCGGRSEFRFVVGFVRSNDA
jgi:hypothetical protein